MAKVKGALHSDSVGGKFAGQMIFRRGKKTTTVTSFYKPGSFKKFIPSLTQLAQREKYGKAVEAWRALSPSEKEIFNGLSKLKGGGVSGWNLFFVQYSPVVDPYFIAHYKMNEISGNTVSDSIGNNDCSSIDDLSYLSIIGKINNAFNFVFSVDFIKIPYNSNFNFSVGKPFSISAWLYVDNANIARSILNQYNDVDGWSFYLAGSNRLNFYNNIYDFVSDNEANIGQWNHVCITHDGYGSYNLYLNNIKTSTNQFEPSNNNGDLTIGNETRLGDSLARGLDDLRIYTRVLTDEEVAFIYNNGNGTEENL